LSDGATIVVVGGCASGAVVGVGVGVGVGASHVLVLWQLSPPGLSGFPGLLRTATAGAAISMKKITAHVIAGFHLGFVSGTSLPPRSRYLEPGIGPKGSRMERDFGASERKRGGAHCAVTGVALSCM
jgi:hypothetical protein